MADRLPRAGARGHLPAGTTCEEFFEEARLNPEASSITGVVCGIRVEDIEDQLMQKIPPRQAGRRDGRLAVRLTRDLWSPDPTHRILADTAGNRVCAWPDGA